MAIAVAYLLLATLLVGFKPEQVGLSVFCLALFFVSTGTRQFLFAFGAFIVFWVLFDFMKALPNYAVSPVHIRDLYEADKRLFHVGGLSYNEYWAAHTSTPLDLATGFAYLCWMPVPLGFGIYLFARKRAFVVPFALTFLWVNLLGFVIYYTFPAAPPWYVQLHGFDLNLHTPGNTAGLHRFDLFFGIHLFEGLYAKSSNVFAAMPSLHAAYPLVTLYYGLKSRAGWINVFLGLVVLGIWFAAVYTSHHYVLDVLAGIGCAVVGIFFWEKGLMRSGRFRRFLAGYQERVA
ncbi:PAP2 superfamily protein [Dinghuibacter silviterrae]|uniref:PAP2 superfamily protein n=2 Tax=Dinghuibacter silviterrae TaxID=1539049 RepID=A0A4R8DUT2_9BACT|nr:PAP2 superfamily protein [Dinghuibacter silviterrae]